MDNKDLADAWKRGELSDKELERLTQKRAEEDFHFNLIGLEMFYEPIGDGTAREPQRPARP